MRHGSPYLYIPESLISVTGGAIHESEFRRLLYLIRLSANVERPLPLKSFHFYR